MFLIALWGIPNVVSPAVLSFDFWCDFAPGTLPPTHTRYPTEYGKLFPHPDLSVNCPIRRFFFTGNQAELFGTPTGQIFALSIFEIAPSGYRRFH